MVRVTARPGDPNYPEVLWQHPEPNIQQTINLNNQGLSPGDNVDDYLDQYLEDGVEVQIEPGTYHHDGSAFQSQLTIADAKITGLGDIGDVVWDGSGDNLDRRSDVHVDDGVFVIENITRSGPSENARWRPTAAAGAECVHKWFRQPDGQIDGFDESGIWTPSYGSSGPHNEGNLRFLWCEIQHFSDNGCYIDGFTDGQAIVVGGYYARSEITNMRIGLPHTRLYGVTIHGAPGNADQGYQNWRALWIRQPGDDIVIDQCDIVQDTDNVVVQFRDDSSSGSGLMTNTRIRNEGDVGAIIAEYDADSNWDFQNIHITGSGNLGTSVTLDGNSQVGSGADQADTDPWWGIEDFNGSGGGGGGGTGPSSGPHREPNWRAGQPALRFDRNGVYSTGIYDQPLQPPYTYVCAAQYDPPESGVPSPPDDHDYLIYGPREEGSHMAFDLNREGNFNLWAGGNGISVPADTFPHIFTLVVDGQDSILRVDNTENVGDAGTNAQHGTIIGGNHIDRDRLMAGWVGLVQVYDRRLSQLERDRLSNELIDRFGIGTFL